MNAWYTLRCGTRVYQDFFWIDGKKTVLSALFSLFMLVSIFLSVYFFSKTRAMKRDPLYKSDNFARDEEDDERRHNQFTNAVIDSFMRETIVEN